MVFNPSMVKLFRRERERKGGGGGGEGKEGMLFDVTVTLSLIVLSSIFLLIHLDTILLLTKICQD